MTKLQNSQRNIPAALSVWNLSYTQCTNLYGCCTPIWRSIGHLKTVWEVTAQPFECIWQGQSDHNSDHQPDHTSDHALQTALQAPTSATAAGTYGTSPFSPWELCFPAELPGVSALRFHLKTQLRPPGGAWPSPHGWSVPERFFDSPPTASWGQEPKIIVLGRAQTFVWRLTLTNTLTIDCW